MAFGRRSNDTVGGAGAATDAGTYRGSGSSGGSADLPPHILRLIATM